MTNPSPTLKIVRLDGIYAQSPIFTIPHTYTEYPTTTDPSTIATRIGDAEVVITTRVPITRSTLEACPDLKFLAVLAAGYDMVDLEACKEHGVKVANVPGANSESVVEHAVAFYFALRRNLVGMHAKLIDGKEEWKSKGSLVSYWGSLPRTCREETICILGYGQLGQRLQTLFHSLGSTILLPDHKHTPPSLLRPNRTEFTAALKRSTVLILTLPLTPSTIDTISTPELELLHPDTIIINVSRGGIVNESALVEALRTKRIAGAATDVFLEEPAGRENPLIKAAEEWKDDPEMAGRLILSPHVAWFARSSIEKLRNTVTANVEAWSRGEDLNLIA